MIKRFVVFEDLPRINRKLAPAYNRKTRKVYMRCTNEWKKKFSSVVVQLQEQADVEITENIDLIIYLFISPSEDVDAPIKGLFDALEVSGAIESDNLIQNIVMMRSEKQEEEYAIIEVYEEGKVHDIMETAFYEKEI